jgi:hypothetical protein
MFAFGTSAKSTVNGMNRKGEGIFLHVGGSSLQCLVGNFIYEYFFFRLLKFNIIFVHGVRPYAVSAARA